MTLRQAHFSSIDQVPESLREFAQEGEGGAVVDIPEGREVMAVDKTLWDSRHKAINEREAEVRRLKGDKKSVLDEFEKLKAEHAETLARLEGLGDDADIEKKIKAASDQRVQQIAKQKEQEVAAARAAADAASEAVKAASVEHERDLKWAEVYSALSSAKAFDPDLVADKVMQQVRVSRDEDGRIIRRSDGRAVLEVVVDGVVQVTGDGAPKSVADWIKADFVASHPMQFEGVGAAGGGARGGGGRGVPGTSTQNPLKTGDMLTFARVSKSDPQLAKRWADEVGYRPPA